MGRMISLNKWKPYGLWWVFPIHWGYLSCSRIGMQPKTAVYVRWMPSLLSELWYLFARKVLLGIHSTHSSDEITDPSPSSSPSRTWISSHYFTTQWQYNCMYACDGRGELAKKLLLAGIFLRSCFLVAVSYQ